LPRYLIVSSPHALNNWRALLNWQLRYIVSIICQLVRLWWVISKLITADSADLR
jgi:hypothetical protein